MNNCTTCENAIFDQLWGEYKCSVKQQWIGQPDLHVGCGDYKEGKPQESKREYGAK